MKKYTYGYDVISDYLRDKLSWEDARTILMEIDPTNPFIKEEDKREADAKAHEAQLEAEYAVKRADREAAKSSSGDYYSKTAKALSTSQLSFIDIQAEAKKLYEKVESSRSEMTKTLNGMKGTYTEGAISKKRAEMFDTLASTTKAEIESFGENIRRSIEAAEQKIAGIVAAAPTADQLRLLEALKMQGSVGENEIKAIVPALTGNYRALSTLRSIAREVGADLYIPPQYDYEKLSESLEWTKTTLVAYTDALSDYAKDGIWPEDATNFEAQYFFKGYDLDSYRKNAVEILDGNAQAGQFKVRVEPRKLTEKEHSLISSLFDSLDPRFVKSEVNEAAKSPEMRKLISMHDVYGSMLEPTGAAE